MGGLNLEVFKVRLRRAPTIMPPHTGPHWIYMLLIQFFLFLFL